MRTILLLATAAMLAVSATSHAAEIHDAAQDGDAGRVAAILADDPSQTELRNERNEMPIHVAGMGGHAEVIRVLLDAGSPVDAGDNENSTALDVAGIFGHYELAVFLLERGADPAHRDDNGMTPLHFACYNGNADIAELLIEHGAEATATTNSSSTPLHGAAYDGSTGCISLLLEHGADVNARNAAGYTPVLSAAAGGAGTEAFELLVSNGADVHDRTFEGDTALMSAARAGNTDVIQILIDAGASVNARNDFGWTAVQTATQGASSEVLAIFLENGADANTSDSFGRTVLWWACVSGNLEAAELLIENGADVNARPTHGVTAIMRAFDAGHYELVALLLEHGADVNDVDENWQRTVLHGAALRGWEDFTELFLDAGADHSVKDAEGMTALHYAGKYGHRAVAELLESRGAKARGLEKNYGRCALLDREVANGQASLWYLGHCGYAVKTEDHFLIFDYWSGAGGDPASPCLTNGRIDPSEIADENVYVFVTHEHGDHYDEVINGWGDEIEGLTYIFGFRPELTPAYRDSGYFGPEYTYVGPRETATIDGMEIRTISANDAGVGFLVEVDGLTFYHAGDHAGWAADERDGFFAEIDYLDPFVDELDLAFVNVTGCHANDPERLKEGNIYTLNTLAPNVLIPTHAANREYVYTQAADELAAAGVTTSVCCPGNRGDGFFYNGESID